MDARDGASTPIRAGTSTGTRTGTSTRTGNGTGNGTGIGSGVAARARWDIGFGAVMLAGALLALFVWFPSDIRTGFIFTNAIGRVEPGDAFFPVLLASVLAALGAVQILIALTRRGPPGAPRRLTGANLRFLAELLGIVLAGLVVIYWLGPIVVAALGALGVLEGGYRLYTDTAPYKYLGFLAGGLGMTLALIWRTEGGLRRASLLSVVLVLLASILIFDVLLKNVLLPPNAEF
ncbi:MAG: hypothetical protein AAF577_15265 [Pseudomonadota bacterium]